MNEQVAKDLIELVNSLKGLVKSRSVKYGQTNFQYVPLDDILSKVKENAKWALLQPITEENGVPVVKNILIHESGAKVESGAFPLLIKGDRMQDVGAVITYSRRYSLGAFLGIATETDNDANFESDVKEVKATEKQAQFIQNLYNDEEIAKMLGRLNKKELSELTLDEASKMIEARKK